jgi:3-hydroxyisobutyrate dehydrogenase-like beta-hydroxyacid dehydrogenase
MSPQESARDKTVGIVGVGVMGGGMAANLLKGGWPLVVYDLDQAKVQHFVSLGARAALGPADVAREASILISMVETTAQSEEVIMGENGFQATAEPGDVILSMATIDPLAVKRWHGTLAERGIELIDAPVSGGQQRAEAGDLSIICGGKAETVERVRPILESMARQIFHMGEVGQGLAMKLVNNMLIQIGTIAVAEAMVLGAKAGLDPQAMIDVIRQSTGHSVAFEMRAPRYLTGDFEPGGTVDITYKDQELQTSFAKALGVPLFLANVTQQIYQWARGLGHSKKDSSITVTMYEQAAGVQLGPRKKEENP